MPMGTEGVAKFFAGLGAGPALRQQAEAKGRMDAMRAALTDAQIRNTGNDAALKQVKLDALDPATLGAALAATGVPQDQSGGAAGLVRAGQNVNEVSGLMKTLQGLGLQRAARDAAVRGDLNGANAQLFGLADKPVTLSQVTDGVALNPTVTPDSNAFDPTAVGQAMIAQRQASAANSMAGVGANNALRDLRAVQTQAGGFNPNTGGGKNKLPPVSDITSILPKTRPAADPLATPAPDPAQVAQVISWLGMHPGANVGDYVNQAPVGSPGAVVPSDTDALMNAVKAPPMSGPSGDVETPAENAAEPGEETVTGQGGSGPKMPASQAEFDALPSGSLFINPADGRLMRKK